MFGTFPAHLALRPDPGLLSADEWRQVTDYLLKRGFTQTERIFRREAADLGPDGRPKHDRIDQIGPKKYGKALILLSNWVENNLDVYKVSRFDPSPAVSPNNPAVRT